MTLSEQRKNWEKGLTPLTVIKVDDAMILVILESSNATNDRRYHCHRYFTIGQDWVCSVDGQRVPLKAVFSWLNNPVSTTTLEGEYITPEPA